MKLPISYDQFKKNPITAVTFCMLVVVGYLYVDSKSNEKARLKDCSEEVIDLRNELRTIQNKQRLTDSALASAVTELKILSKLGRI